MCSMLQQIVFMPSSIGWCSIFPDIDLPWWWAVEHDLGRWRWSYKPCASTTPRISRWYETDSIHLAFCFAFRRSYSTIQLHLLCSASQEYSKWTWVIRLFQASKVSLKKPRRASITCTRWCRTARSKFQQLMSTIQLQRLVNFFQILFTYSTVLLCFDWIASGWNVFL